MSDDTKAIEKVEPKDDEVEEPEFESTEAEFRAIYNECETTQQKLLKIANRMAQRNSDAADVLRQVANELIPLLKSVVSASGGAFDAMEAQLELLESEGGEGGGSEGLEDEDAVDFYRVITADLKLIEQAIEASVGGDQRVALQALRDMNVQMRERIVELSDLEEEEIERLANEPPSEDEDEGETTS